MGSGPVMKMDKFDKELFTNALKETEGSFDERVTIKRWTGTTNGDDAAGIAATDNFVNIPTHACIKNISPREINYPNSIYAMGDLNAEFTVAVFGAESGQGDNQPAGRRSDRVVYRNREYKIVGHVERKFLFKRTFWKAVLRQVAIP
jgi:hypothetical protein